TPLGRRGRRRRHRRDAARRGRRRQRTSADGLHAVDGRGRQRAPRPARPPARPRRRPVTSDRRRQDRSRSRARARPCRYRRAPGRPRLVLTVRPDADCDKLSPGMRSDAPKRIEGFSEAVFGFSLALLAFSLEVPRSIDELRLLAVAQLVPPLAAFALMCWIWAEHNAFF